MQKILAQCTHRLIQAPMAGVQNEDLAIAVCAAGALGSLPAAMLSHEDLNQALARLQAQSGGRPYNVNFFAHVPETVSEAQTAAWHRVLQPYFARWGVNPDAVPSAPSRRPFDESVLPLLRRYRPAVVSFHFGVPAAPLLAAVRETGAKIMATATTVAEARFLVQNGVDAVIAQGWEAGGHRGWFLDKNPHHQSGTFALLPNIVRAVSVPVVAAGGISDAATVRAAFALGASAVQVGTAFLLADEAQTSPAHRAALQSSAAEYTAVSNVFSGGGARGVVNGLMRDLGVWHDDAPPFPHAAAAVNALRRVAEAQQNFDFTPMWAGQNARLAQSGSAAQIIARLMDK
ncbi:nitronate monooxygenase family protein [Conchiformibius steedae]|uniref:NAD(P)H-dependent flavin oxidoreductase n=1 Tax=Conchiformibius steedae TaxID=153493 RepID=UPI0026EEE5CB|nr:nitronate monooxygenase [Conchiformibius steedae]